MEVTLMPRRSMISGGGFLFYFILFYFILFSKLLEKLTNLRDVDGWTSGWMDVVTLNYIDSIDVGWTNWSDGIYFYYNYSSFSFPYISIAN